MRAIKLRFEGVRQEISQQKKKQQVANSERPAWYRKFSLSAAWEFPERRRSRESLYSSLKGGLKMLQ